MKKLLLLFFAVFTTLVALAYDFSAVAPSGQTLYFTINDSNAMVTYPGSVSAPYGGYTAPTGALTIPSSVTYNTTTYPVTGISNYAFHGCIGLTSITIPTSVTYIGYTSFGNCSGLNRLTIHDSLTYIGPFAFEGCTGLTSISIGSSVTTLSGGAFDGCTNVDTLFFNARNLNTTSFWYNPSTIYQHYGFRPLTNLHVLVIGDSVQTIPNGAFYGCSNVDTLYYNARNLSTSSMSNIDTINLFRPLTNLNVLVIGDSVQILPAFVFSYQRQIISVIIPNSVTSIGYAALGYCSSLLSVIMEPLTPPSLAQNAFSYNNNNRMFYVPCSAMADYSSSNDWIPYSSSITHKGVDIDITLHCEASQGTVSVIPVDGWDVDCDSMAVISAEAYHGYHFNHWSTGSTHPTDTIHLFGDTVITAYFDLNEYMLSLSTNDPQQGVVIGAGLYHHGDTATISAEPAIHHHFLSWNDGEVESLRQIVIVSDTAFSATFALDTVHVELLSNDITMGTVSGGGDYPYGEMVTATATANTGYIFFQWDNGVCENPYTFAAVSDTTITALFVDQGQEGVENPSGATFSVYSSEMGIHVEGAGNDLVRIYDMNGRQLESARHVDGMSFKVPTAGVYLVQVGDSPAQKVVVVR